MSIEIGQGLQVYVATVALAREISGNENLISWFTCEDPEGDDCTCAICGEKFNYLQKSIAHFDEHVRKLLPWM